MGILVVQEPRRLDHCENAAFSRHRHGFVEEQVGELLVGEGAVLLRIRRGAIASTLGRQRRGEGRVADNDRDLLRDKAIFLCVEKAAPMERLAGKAWEELHAGANILGLQGVARSEEHTSELQSLMRISYAV